MIRTGLAFAFVLGAATCGATAAADTVRAHGFLLVQTCPRGTADGDVYVVDAATGRKRFLVRAGYADEPRWSPDGRRVLVARGRDFWVYPLRGGKPRNVTRTRGWKSGARWSPAADRIAFLVGTGTGSSRLYVTRVGGKPRLVRSHVDAVAWSPKGGELAFAPDLFSQLRGATIWSVSARGGRARPLGGHGGGLVVDIAWGRTRLLSYTAGDAFSGTTHLLRAGRDRELRRNEGLQFLANGSYVFTRGTKILFSDGRSPGRLPSRSVAPTWSPDGSYVAYTNWHLDTLYVARGDGSGRLGFDLGLSPCNIAWQPFPWVH